MGIRGQQRLWTPRAIARVVVALGVIVGLGISFAGLGEPSSVRALAAEPTLSVEISKAQVAPGETFTVNINQDVDFPTLGAEATIYFDASKLELLDAQPGASYADAQFLMGIAPQTNEDALAEANSTGVLVKMATFYLPGSGSVNAGRDLFAVLTMRARPGASGESELRIGSFEHIGQDPLSSNEIVISDVPGFVPDPPGTNLTPAAVVNGVVKIGGSGGGTAPSASAGASGSVTPTPKRSGTPRPSRTSTVGGVIASPGNVSLSVDPAESAVALGATFSTSVKINSPVEVRGGSIDLKFDREVISIESIEAGEDFATATQSGYESLITTANKDGKLTGLAISLRSSDDPLAAGEIDFFRITFKGLTDGSSDVEITKAFVIDADGEELAVSTTKNGKATIGSGGGGGSMLPLLAGGLVAVGALGGGGWFIYRSRRQRWGV